jgi:hypothetical protein
MSPVLPVGIAIIVLTLFLDLLEMSYQRILWFMKTLRFWLYFTLHVGLSCLAAYFLRSKISEWYLLAAAATFLGAAVISNTNIQLAGFSLLPIADLFVSIKTKMIDQAGQDKGTVLRKAYLIQRLRKLDANKLGEASSSALLAAGQPASKVQAKLAKARAVGGGNQEYLKNILIDMLLKANLTFAEENIDKWEKEA